jgi:hypothetical protein
MTGAVMDEDEQPDDGQEPETVTFSGSVTLPPASARGG